MVWRLFRAYVKTVFTLKSSGFVQYKLNFKVLKNGLTLVVDCKIIRNAPLLTCYEQGLNVININTHRSTKLDIGESTMLINTHDNNLFVSRTNQRQQFKAQKTNSSNLQSFTGTSIYGNSKIDSSKLKDSFLANVSFMGTTSSRGTSEKSEVENLYSSDSAKELASKRAELIKRYKEIQAATKDSDFAKKQMADKTLSELRKEIQQLDMDIITIEEEVLFGDKW